MKKILMACALVLSLCYLGGCSKDDEPEKDDYKASGSVQIDKNSFSIKCAYKIEFEDGQTEYMFCDRDVFKYSNSDSRNFVYSCIAFVCNNKDLEFIGIGYDVDSNEDSGLSYDMDYSEIGNFYDYGSFSIDKGTLKSSAKSLPMEGYDLANDKQLGISYVTYSVEGTPRDITDLVGSDDYSTRGIEVKVITEPDQIAFLKKLMPKHN